MLSNYLNMVRDQSAADRATSLENFTEFQNVHKQKAAQGQSQQASE